MLAGGVPFLLSPALLAEWRGVLLRPRLTALHGLTADAIDEVLTELTTRAMLREPPKCQIAPPDPNDQHLVDLLILETQAILVTGDDSLRSAVIAMNRMAWTPRQWLTANP